MARLLTVTMVMLSLLGGVLPVGAQSPFISRGSPKKVSPAQTLPHPFLARIATLQQRINQKMATLARQAKETGSLRPLMSLIIISLVYGILHATGPGHGKAIATSYLISRGRKLQGGLVMGNLIALFHGLSGVVLVLIVHFVLQKSLMGPLQSVTRTTQLISYALIALLGGVMLAWNLLLWFRQQGNDAFYQIGRYKERKRGLLAMALVVGMVPCPGVVMLMLFCLSLNMLGVGLVLALFMILGMALTISAVGVVGLAGKNLALGALECRTRLAEMIERGIKTAAALMVTLIGLLFLIAML